jgi:hypothetical protein
LWKKGFTFHLALTNEFLHYLRLYAKQEELSLAPWLDLGLDIFLGEEHSILCLAACVQIHFLVLWSPEKNEKNEEKMLSDFFKLFGLLV